LYSNILLSVRLEKRIGIHSWFDADSMQISFVFQTIHAGRQRAGTVVEIEEEEEKGRSDVCHRIMFTPWGLKDGLIKRFWW
jgi:hypothetical protein